MAAIFVDKYTQKMYNKSWQHGLGQKVLCHNNTIKLLSVENFNYYKTRMTLCFILQFYSLSEFASSVCGEYSVFVRIYVRVYVSVWLWLRLYVRACSHAHSCVREDGHAWE